MTPAPTWWVYILLCRGGTYYTGIARDPGKRYLRHRDGRGAAYTRINPPVALLAAKSCPDRAAALREEAALRRRPRREKEEWIETFAVSGKGALAGGLPSGDAT